MSTLCVRRLFSGPALAALVACGTDSAGGNPASGGAPGTGAGSSGGAGTGAKLDSGAGPGALANDGGNTTPGGDGGSVVAGQVRFIAVGDTGKGNANQTTVGATMANVCQTRGCDFVLLLGDNIYESGAASVNDAKWQSRFEVPYAQVNNAGGNAVAFWPVLGNHDYGSAGLPSSADFSVAQNEVDYSTSNVNTTHRWQLPSAYWHKTSGSGNVELFGTDTNQAYFSDDVAQRTDMAAWLTASTAQWKIAAGHHPYLSNGEHGNAGAYDGTTKGVDSGSGVKSFLDDVVCGKVDLYLCGHDHSMQWLTNKCAGTSLVVSGAGSDPTTLPGSNTTEFASASLGILYVVIENKTLTAEFIKANGQVAFTKTLQKP